MPTRIAPTSPLRATSARATVRSSTTATAGRDRRIPRRGSPLTEGELDYAREQAGPMGVQARGWPIVTGPGARRAVAEPGPAGLVRSGGRGAHRRWFPQRRPTREWLTCASRSRRAPPAWPGSRWTSSRTPRMPRTPSRPERVEGAWFRDGVTAWTTSNTRWRGCCGRIAIVEAGEAGSGDDFPRRLWAAALLLALNPVRAAFGLPRKGRSPRPQRGWRRRRCDRRSRRLRGRRAGRSAARPVRRERALVPPRGPALVAAVLAVTDLFRRPPSPEPRSTAARGARAGGVPLVARPALLVLALGAGADVGIAVCAGAMLLGEALLTGLIVRRPPTAARCAGPAACSRSG